MVEPDDVIANAPAAKWAGMELHNALQANGVAVRKISQFAEATPNDMIVRVSGFQHASAKVLFSQHKLIIPGHPESLCLISAVEQERSVILASGMDPRGLAYALLDLADKVTCYEQLDQAFDFPQPQLESPASRLRSLMRGFESEVEDKSWFYDRDYWRDYLDLLARCRINKLNFTTGMGYNLAQNISDSYLLFPYPFLLEVPGYRVEVVGLPTGERERNLATLQFIGAECLMRAIDFQLGIWTLAYEWTDSPNATHRITGLNPRNHSQYCHDALAQLLREVPTINGITFRVHEESGIPRGEESFWATQFKAIADCGRRVEIDLHAKSMAPDTLEYAISTGQPVTVSPKYGGEHQTLPYHQAALRLRECPGPGALTDTGEGLLRGDRSFTRYGYADTLAEDRRWSTVFRIWPGTQRFLLSGSPSLFSAYGRQASFCGADGIELSEPLHFKGRRGSGLPGGRCAYADESLEPSRDFHKYDIFYRQWGRLAYNPASNPETWRRHLRKEFGSATEAVEQALEAATIILPLFTTVHTPSASCASYWPEIYRNIPMANTEWKIPSWDMLAPKLFGNVSALDPQLFLSPDEYGESLLYGPITGKYSPLEVSRWFADCADTMNSALERARTSIGNGSSTPAFRRLEEDVLILQGIAKFFAGKLSAAVFWRIHVHSGNREAGKTAIEEYQKGRGAWAEMAKRAGNVYRMNIAYGEYLTSGHWLDRLSEFDQDIEDMRNRFGQNFYKADQLHEAASARALAIAKDPSPRPRLTVRHTPPKQFSPGDSLPLSLAIDGHEPMRGLLYYRRVNQGEHWRSTELHRENTFFTGEIPADYSMCRFPLQYYFELFPTATTATLYPGLNPDLTNTPYFVVRRR